MLARQADQPFNDENWIFEIKWDGYRAIAETGKEFRFYSRNGLSFISQYPEITDELRKIKSTLVLDGEVVAMDEKGVPSFQLLQKIIRAKGQPHWPTMFLIFLKRIKKRDLTGKRTTF